MGISNGVGTLSGMVCPLIVGAMTKHKVRSMCFFQHNCFQSTFFCSFKCPFLHSRQERSGRVCSWLPPSFIMEVLYSMVCIWIYHYHHCHQHQWVQIYNKAGSSLLLQASLRQEKNKLGRSPNSWVMKNVESWTKMNSQMKQRNCIERVAEPATEPRTRGQTPTEQGGSEGEDGSPIGTKLRSTCNRLGPITTSTEAKWTESWHRNRSTLHTVGRRPCAAAQRTAGCDRELWMCGFNEGGDIFQQVCTVTEMKFKETPK